MINYFLQNILQPGVASKTIVLFYILMSAGLSQKMFNQENEFHKQAILLLNENKIEEAKQLLKYSINEYSYSQSYFELAKIEYDENTIASRKRARYFLQNAIWKEPENIEYRLLMAELMEYFSSDMAYDVYEDIIEIKPECVEALYNLGRINEQRFYEYYKSIMKDESSPAMSYDGFAIEDFVLAEKYFRKAIGLQPEKTEPYLHLSYLYQEAGLLNKGIPLLKEVIRIEPDNKNAFLFLGYLYYKTSEFDSSQIAFKKALELMNEQEREDFQVETAMLFFPEDEIDKADIDSVLNKFWNERDPLYLTEYNERLLEHYSRVAYSNLKFSVEKQEVKGWNSDRGEVLIRYGEPENRVRFRPYINAGGKTALMLKTDLWIYDDKEFAFTDDYWTGEFKFSAPNYSGRHFSQYYYDTHTYAGYLRRSDPEDYEPVFKGPTFSLPFCINQFKDIENSENKSTQVFLNYAVDITGRFEFRNRYKLEHRCGLFLLDLNANKISEVQKDYQYLEERYKLVLNKDEKYWVNTLQLETKPDTAIIAFEMIRNKDNGVSSNHFGYRIKEFNNSDLSLSDIVLAEKVNHSAEATGPLKRKDIYILPNPANIFTPENDIYIYYEVYNLTKDNQNKTNFEQRVTVTKLEKTDLFDDIYTAVSGLFGSSGSDEIILSTDYQSFDQNTQVYLQIDMNNYEPGEYEIDISVLDKLTGEKVSERTKMTWSN